LKETDPNEALFFGKVTAGITHEIQNVLAIIKESSGLMEDILMMNREEEFKFLDKFQDTILMLKKQVKRGVELTSALNKFAHSPDKIETQINVLDAVGRLVFLIRRLAKLKAVEIKLLKNNDPLVLTTNLVKFQMTFFLCLESILNLTKKGCVINISSEKIDSQIIIKISCQGDLPSSDIFCKSISSSYQWPFILQTCREINATAETDIEANGIKLYFQ